MITLKSRVAAAAAAAGLCLLWASPATAHVGIAEKEQTAGKPAVLTFTVGHGCGSSPTTRLEIQIPESIVNVTPVRNAFYDITVETEELAEPIESDHGDPITSRESVVVYAATEPLPAGQRDSVQLSMTVPADAVNTTLYFPVVQTCEEGVNRWIEIPATGNDAELESPAPFINVAAGGESDDDDSNGLAVVALIVGALGLAFGVGGFITATRKK